MLSPGWGDTSLAKAEATHYYTTYRPPSAEHLMPRVLRKRNLELDQATLGQRAQTRGCVRPCSCYRIARHAWMARGRRLYFSSCTAGASAAKKLVWH